MKEERIRELMEQVGMPESHSLKGALEQVANEVAQEHMQKLEEFKAYVEEEKQKKEEEEADALSSMKKEIMVILDSADEFKDVIDKGIHVILNNGPAIGKLFDAFTDAIVTRNMKTIKAYVDRGGMTQDQAILLVIGSRENAYQAAQSMKIK